MAILIEARHREHAAWLLEGSFALRHRILVQRLGWHLPTARHGQETDAFDGGDTCHLISRTAGGRIRGTMRLTPSLSPNVTCDVLQATMPTAFPRAQHIVECSRLCIDLDLPSHERRAARADLFLSQVEVCDVFGWQQTIGVLLQSVVQYFIRSGLSVDFLSPPLRFADSTETSVAFLLETGPAALATARAVLGLNSTLVMPYADRGNAEPLPLARVA